MTEQEEAAKPAKSVSKKVTPKKSKSKKSNKSSKRSAKANGASKTVVPKRPYPRVTIESALKIPQLLKEKNGGNAWPPSEVAASVGLSPTNPDFFYLAAASRDFGFTEGSRDSELISLAPFGRDVVYAPSKAEEEKQLRQALTNVDIFKRVLEYYKGANLP